jgi:cell division protein FtsZ
MESLPVVAVIGVGSLGCYITSAIVSHGVSEEIVEEFSFDPVRAGIRSIYLHKSGRILQEAEPEVCFQLKPDSKDENYQLQSSDFERLKQQLQQADMVFLVGALGGNNGETMVQLAALCCDWKIPAVGFVVLPFLFEGKPKLHQATVDLSRLEQLCMGVLSFPNDKLKLVLGAQAPLEQSLDASNKFLAKLLAKLHQMLTTPGFINLDFNDVLAVLSAQGKAVVSITELAVSDESQNLDKTMEQLINEGIQCSLADVQHINTATALVWYLEVPANFPLQCYVLLGDLVAQRFPFATTIISGLDTSCAGWLKLTFIATGMSKLKTV